MYTKMKNKTKNNEEFGEALTFAANNDKFETVEKLTKSWIKDCRNLNIIQEPKYNIKNKIIIVTLMHVEIRTVFGIAKVITDIFAEIYKISFISAEI